MRRKANHIFIGIGLMCVFLCSCSDYPVEGDLPAGQSKLCFMYDVDEVGTPGEASVWSAQWAEWDKEILCDTLLHQEPVTTMEDDPFGLRIHAGNENSDLEILIIGERGKLQEGGIGYGIYYTGLRDYQGIVSLYGWHPDRVTQLYRYDDKADFSDQELGIMGSDEALQVVQEILENCGMSGMRNAVMLSFDADTMNMHEDMRKAHFDESQKKRDELSEEMPEEPQEEPQGAAGWKWTEKDEAYYMRYVQTVENIPVMNHEWCTDSPDTDVMALVNAKGLFDLQVSYVVNPIEQGDRAKLITPRQAQESLMEYYNQTIIDNPIWVESQCLYYISLRDKTDIKLIPAWVFCIAQEYEYTEDDDEPGVMLMDYSHYVIDAITGERLLSADVEDRGRGK